MVFLLLLSEPLRGSPRYRLGWLDVFPAPINLQLFITILYDFISEFPAFFDKKLMKYWLGCVRGKARNN